MLGTPISIIANMPSSDVDLDMENEGGLATRSAFPPLNKKLVLIYVGSTVLLGLLCLRTFLHPPLVFPPLFGWSASYRPAATATPPSRPPKEPLPQSH